MSSVQQVLLLPHEWRGDAPKLVDEYKRAFTKAKELFVVSAFLTEWPKDLVLNSRCDVFRLIVGADFGTTRRAALEAALRWLPKRFKGNVLAYNKHGVNFHPKALLWKERDGTGYFLIGSSNLTRAAFDSNVEANVSLRLTADQYEQAQAWVDEIDASSVDVNAAWLRRYKEAPVRGGPGRGNRATNGRTSIGEASVFDLRLGLATDKARKKFAKYLLDRRAQLAAFDAGVGRQLVGLFRGAAKKKTWEDEDNLAFYEQLLTLWAASPRTRMGGLQWVMRGKHGDHQELARSLVSVIDAPAALRDAQVVAESDRLQNLRVPTRAAVFSELLCYLFPKRYPILDEPVRKWRSAVGFDKGVGGTEGERYLRLARAMRAALQADGPRELGLENLAELDTLIWFLRKGEPSKRT